MYKYTTTVYISNDKYNDIWEFGIKLKSSTKFEFLNTRIEFNRGNNGREDEVLRIEYFSENGDKKEAENNIDNMLGVLSYMFRFPLERDLYVNKSKVIDIPVFEKTTGYSKLINIELLDQKIGRFRKNKSLFYQSIKVLNAAQKYNYMHEGLLEEAFLNYFKVIDHIAGYEYEVNFKKRKLAIKNQDMNIFLKNTIEESLGIKYSDNKIKDITQKLESIIINLAIDGVFYKISIFCKEYNIDICPNMLHKAIKVRNKIAHGKYVSEEDIREVYLDILELSYEFISYGFFKTKYSDVALDSHIDIF